MPTNSATSVVLGKEFVQSLIDKGLVPAQCRRVVIDAEVGKAVRLVYECFAEPSILDVMVTADINVMEDRR